MQNTHALRTSGILSKTHREWVSAANALAVLCLALATSTTTRAQDAWFTGVGDFPGGRFDSRASDISADGSVVVGEGSVNGANAAFRWTRQGGLEDLGYLQFGRGARAYAISPDGTAIVGQAWNFSGTEAFLWTRDEGLIGLGKLPGGESHAMGYGVANAGTAVVGISRSYQGQVWEAFLWTPADGMIGLGAISDQNFYSSASSISADGRLVFGTTSKGGGVLGAFRWTSDGGFEALPAPFGRNSGIGACNLDGTRLIGSNGDAPTYWDESDTPVQIPAYDRQTHARDLADDTFAVVGKTRAPDNRYQDIAVIWLGPDLFFRSLQEMLEIDYNLDLGSWELLGATAISADGKTITGQGRNPDGNYEGWVAHLGDSCPADMNGDGIADESDAMLFFTMWESGDMAADFDHNDRLTTQDIIYYLRSWAGGCL